ncbi:MAG TPA: phosphotransferase [Terracidiphilus sp.]|jgi:Ser/Thr protein kinase RdoA (MazF antagonist)|nr:phosphotransferase [Terracidiphilus sp.]
MTGITMDAATKVHGMDGALVEHDWPPLTLADLRTLLREFPAIGEPVEILSVSPRPFSAAGLVRTAQGNVFVKRHHRSVRDRDGLLEEHRFLAHLHAHRAPVPRVFASASGETAIELGEWVCEVHEAGNGTDLYEDAFSWTPFRCAQHAYAAGCALARLHCASDGFQEPRRKIQPLVASFTIFAASDPVRQMERYLCARPALAQHKPVHACAERALALLAPFHSELAPLLDSLAPLWTHNDLHASNLFWSSDSEGAQATAIIDFGLSDRTNAVHDLAHAIERNIVEWLALTANPERPDDVPVHMGHLSALLDGYESLRPLSPAEAAALAPMTALCHTEFALSEADYFLSVLHAEDKAPMAYDGWLVGHARWFHTLAGMRLLDALRMRARSRADLRIDSRTNSRGEEEP